MRQIALLCSFVTLSALACNKDQPASADDGDTDYSLDGATDGSYDGTCADDTDCRAGEICEEDECVGGDRNNSVEEAETILWGADAAVEGIINPAGDLDYYSFTAEGGEFIRISTDLDEEVQDGGGNTVLVLRDPAGKIVATANEFATETGLGGTADAVLFAYLQDEGVYTITVQDDGTYGADPEGYEEGWRGYVYQLTLGEWNQATAEPDSASDASVEYAMESSLLWGTIGVLIEEAGDTDYIELEIDGAIDDTHLIIDGNQDLQGSDLRPQVRLLNAAGEPLTDKIDVGPEDFALAPFIGAGTYLLEITDAAGTGSDNHWAFVHLISREDDSDGSTFVLEAEGNNALEDAQTLEQNASETSGGNAYTFSNMLAMGDEVDDADWYKFEAGYGENFLGICLNALTMGSTYTASMQLYDATGEMVTEWTADGPDAPDLYVANETLDDGDYYLRVAPAAPIDVVPADYYMFTLYVASFEASSYGCPDY